jgi:glycine/D-amino acid oxidase-like deaminating enzyme
MNRSTRRSFLTAGVSAGLTGLTVKAERRIGGSFVNEAFGLGHHIRDGGMFPRPLRQVRAPVVIVGGGVAGLSAAWWLERNGFRDFVLLEMERQAGGNSRWGEDDVTAYPWAAHYVPVPDAGVELVRELFRELGVLSEDGRWNERYLCFEPQERLFLNGRWQEDIEPHIGLTARDREQFRTFEQQMAEYRASGEFTIPIARGAKPSDLDRISMSEWLARNRFDSPYLRWYLDYACRDDYGALARDTSAWAGVHYFASRAPDDKGPLTWPEGNGWIARRLIAKLAAHIQTGQAAFRIARAGSKYRILTVSADGSAGVEYLADFVIFAAPTFLAHYVVEGAPPAGGFVYSPWFTANLRLDRMPRESAGAEPAWDNVVYDSTSLGYVNATHMSVAGRTERTVWTYYYSLAEFTPERARTYLLANDWDCFAGRILDDLERVHPDIRACVSRVDIMRMGHAMVRPAAGFQFGEQRQRWLKPLGRVHFANSDVSGISIFEEAQYRGVEAARAVLRAVGGAGR